MNESLDLDYEQIINLIQCLLSLEDCLQYQIIPLTLEQDCLSLGMVNPEDQAALDFIHSIVSVLGYRLNIQQIDSYAHQLVLAAYLKHNHNVEQPKADISPQASSWDLFNRNKNGKILMMDSIYRQTKFYSQTLT